jgi:proteasome accessory factor C
MPKSAKLSGADRYNFMLALTGYLIQNRQQPIEALAKHFEVTEQEIRSAVVTISLSGVGSYRPDELFFLDYDLLEEGIVDLSFAPTLESVPRLSTRQAAAIASGLAFLAEVVDSKDRSEIDALLAILGSAGKNSAALPFMIQPIKVDRQLSLVRGAIAESRAISCSYINSAGEVSSRKIVPLVMESRDSLWFVRGYDQAKQEVRVFRLDRMREISPLEITSRDELAAIPDSSEIYQVNDSDTEVLFEVDPEAFSLIADYRPDFEIQENKTVQLRIAIGQLANLGRIVSKYSGKVRVLAPERAREIVRQYALRALGTQPELDHIE